MKTFVKLGQSVLIMLGVFMIAMTTGNELFAASATAGVGLFSATMHIHAMTSGKMLFTAPVIPEFTPKTLDEIKEMDDDELLEYTTRKSEFEQAKINARFSEIEKAIRETHDGDELKTALTGLQDQFKTVIDEHKEMYDIVKAMSEKPIEEGKTYKTIGGAIMAGFASKKEEIEKWLNGEADRPLKIEVETVVEKVTIGEDNTIGAGATQVTLTENTNIISAIRKRELRYLANVSEGTIGNKYALWIEEHTEAGGPAFIGEGVAKPESSVLYQEITRPVKKVAAHTKVTTELLADLPQLVSFIQNNLLKRLDIETEDELFNGDGLGDNLTGSITEAVAFTGGSLAASVDDANEADVIEAVALQAEEAFHMPNAIFVHPSIVSKIKTLKSASDGHYLFPDYRNDQTSPINGMRVIPTLGLAADEFLGGDLTVINVLFRSQLGIQIGLDGNDFTENKQTMLAEKRLVQFISANDVNGVITGTFTAAKLALETP